MSFPKTGTTWLQEIVWLIANDLDFSGARSQSIMERFPYLEFPIQHSQQFSIPGIYTIEHQKSPRFIKTHLIPSLLFPNNNNGESNDKLPKIIIIMRYELKEITL